MAKLVLVRPSQWKGSGHPMKNILGKRYIFAPEISLVCTVVQSWKLQKAKENQKLMPFKFWSWLSLNVCRLANSLIHIYEKHNFTSLMYCSQLMAIFIWKVIFILVYIQSDCLVETLPPNSKSFSTFMNQIFVFNL